MSGVSPMMRTRAAILAIAIVAEGLAACGQHTEGMDAAVDRDASIEGASDRTIGFEPDAEDAFDGGCGGGGACADVFFPPPDAQPLDGGCYPYLCHTGQVCVGTSFLGSSVSASCAGVPEECGQDPSALCACLVQSSGAWCDMPKCAIDAGQIVLTCTMQPPP